LTRSSARLLALSVLALLGACSKQAAVEQGLVSAGVSSATADCMSREMAKRLSVEQLQKLSRMSDGSGKTLAQMTIADYIEAARRVDDPTVVITTGAAAAYCNTIR
jgi:hypothetical protein